MFVEKNFPQYARRLEQLRDINPKNLGVDEVEIYRIVKSLPESATQQEVFRLLPEREEELRHDFRSHAEPAEGYKIRQVSMYGIAECIRADLAAEYLKRSDIKSFGKLLNISHDGDRVTIIEDVKRVPTDNSYPVHKLDGLISDLYSGDVADVPA